MVEEMERLAFHENLRLQKMMSVGDERKAGGDRTLPPFKLMEALKHLYRKKALTASDLGHMMGTKQANARVLLQRLEALGFATSEIVGEERIRIFDFRQPQTTRF